MKNLFKTLIPYKWTALLVLMLMAGQAFCEMNLPQYTQALIDTGIQNRGIEHIVPEAITESEFQAASGYMDEDEKALWEDAFEETGEKNDKGAAVLKRKDMSEDELDALDEKLIGPVVSRYAAKNGETLSDAEAYAGSDEGAFADGRGSSSANRNLMAMGIRYAGDCDEEAGLDLLKIQNDFMWRCGGMMLLMSLIVMVFTTLVSLLSARVGASIGKDLRYRLYSNVMSFSNAEMDEFSTSSLITRATNDIQQVQMTSTMILRMVLFAPCICTWSIYSPWQA